MRKKHTAVWAVAAVFAVGCTSITSTMLSRDESNTVWQQHQKLHGVPITLKVPTHVKLYIYETYYLQKVSTGGVTRTERLKLPFPVRDFSQDFIFTEKIFTVDFKRPAAGSYNLRLDLTEDQYIQNVAHDVTDQTIQAVDTLIKKIAPGGIIPKIAGGDGSTPAPMDNLYPTNSVVAVGVFEIDAPDFEQQLSCFINTHLTQAHDAWTVEPSVAYLPRVGFDSEPAGCLTPSVSGNAPALYSDPQAPPHSQVASGAIPNSPGPTFPQPSPLPIASPAGPVIQQRAIQSNGQLQHVANPTYSWSAGSR